MSSLRNLTTFEPHMISVTQEQAETNLKRIQSRSNFQIENRYKKNSQLMQQHLRGELLETHTVVENIAGSKENKIVATKIIYPGEVLGFYFGSIIQRREDCTQNELDITLTIPIHEASSKKILAQCSIIGQLNGKQTRIATTNDAPPISVVKSRYVFAEDVNVEEDIATSNIEAECFQVTLTIDNYTYDVEINGFISAKTINPGDALVWRYTPPDSDYPSFDEYWMERRKNPLLFTTKGDFFPQDKYLPIEFIGRRPNRDLTLFDIGDIKNDKDLKSLLEQAGFRPSQDLCQAVSASGNKNKTNSYSLWLLSMTIAFGLAFFLAKRYRTNFFGTAALLAVAVPLTIAIYNSLENINPPQSTTQKISPRVKRIGG